MSLSSGCVSFMKGTICKNYRGPEILVFVFGDPRPLLLRQVGDGDEASVRSVEMRHLWSHGGEIAMRRWVGVCFGVGWYKLMKKSQTTTWDV